jgi:orotate phosphoribosyltransferase
MYNRQRLMELFRERALKFGEFTLASGKKASYYLDGKQITLHSEGLRLVGEGLLDLLADVQFDAIGGMLLGFLVRKEPKGHGTQRYIEGPVQPGMKVVIVDDVVTTGGSSLQAIDRIQEFGCEVVQVVAIVDRMEGGAANFQARGLRLRSLLTIEDFGIKPPSN